MASRRGFIKIIGGGVILAAGGVGLAAFPVTPDPAAAWRDPSLQADDPRIFALAHAILAPNPHNMQPWKVALEGDSEIVFYPDLDRLLPATDPPNRQIVIGCGAFLELLRIAAAERGLRAEVALFPMGEPYPRLDARPIAHIRLVPDVSAAKDPLFTQVLNRRTNREPFDLARPPSDADLEAVCAAGRRPGLVIEATRTEGEVAALRDLVWRSWQRETETPAALAESIDVMRIGRAAIARHRDGLSLDGPMIELLKFTPAMSREALLDPTSTASQEGAKSWRAMAETSPAFVWIKGEANTRAEQIAVGQAYARMNLEVAARGLALHPWSMPLQEYPEMADLYAETQARFAASAAAPVHMLARIGYAKPVPPAPRRGLSEHLLA